MSFEGFYQQMCEEGHHSIVDAYDYYDSTNPICPICGKTVVWQHLVDTTNGSWDENGKRIDGFIEPEIEQEAKYCECEKCGNKHIISREKYKIPKK